MLAPTMVRGFVNGTGAAINIELGWVPDKVEIYNGTDGDKLHVWLRAKVMAFTSGGTGEVVAGDILQGATNTGVRARVHQVILDTGSWAGGDAAGWFIFFEDEQNGTFGSENVDLLDRSASSVEDGGGISDDNIATVTAQSELFNFDDDSAWAAVTPANGIYPYVGSAGSAAKGFTIGSTPSEDAKLLCWVAYRFQNHV